MLQLQFRLICELPVSSGVVENWGTGHLCSAKVGRSVGFSVAVGKQKPKNKFTRASKQHQYSVQWVWGRLKCHWLTLTAAEEDGEGMQLQRGKTPCTIDGRCLADAEPRSMQSFERVFMLPLAGKLFVLTKVTGLGGRVLGNAQFNIWWSFILLFSWMWNTWQMNAASGIQFHRNDEWVEKNCAHFNSCQCFLISICIH